MERDKRKASSPRRARPQAAASAPAPPRKDSGSPLPSASAGGQRTEGAGAPPKPSSTFTSTWAASRVAAADKDEFGTPRGRARARGRVAVATRFWGAEPGATDRLDAFLGTAEQVGDVVLVGVRVEADGADTMGHLRRRNVSRTTGVAIQPWLSAVHVLNVLTAVAARVGAEYLVNWSMDVRVAPADARCLLRLAAAEDHEAAVVGAALPHHVFADGEHELAGAAAPWNTLAVWHVPTLVRVGAEFAPPPGDPAPSSYAAACPPAQAKTGFLLASSGLVPGVGAAIEESLTASMLQFIHRHGTRSPRSRRRGASAATSASPSVPTAAAKAEGRATHWRHRAWLAKLPSMAWNVPGLSWEEATSQPAASAAELDARVAREQARAGSGDGSGDELARRRDRHWVKVRSKERRARQQHAWLGIPPGTVTHTAECAGGGKGD